jgi:amino acid transporter
MATELRRQLRYGDLLILGVAGAVGTGVLFSSAGMAALAGPGVVLAWVLGGLFYFFVGLTYVDLAVLYPEAGGPSRYSLYTHGPTTNLLNAFSDLIWYLFIPPIEALAAAEGLSYFYPHLVNPNGGPTVAGALVGVILLLLFLPFNYYGVRVFRDSTNLLGAVKLLLYILVGIGFLSFAHFGNFSVAGFAPFGLSGIFAAIPLAMFAFGGIRVIPDYAEETVEPRVLRRSIIATVIGQTIVYVLFAVAFVVALNWQAFALKPGDWAAATKLPGNPFLAIASHGHVAWLLVLTVIIAILGPFVTGYIYQGAGSRVMLAMGRTGILSQRMQALSERYAIPAPALLVFTLVGIIVAYISAPLPSIYSLISDAVVAGYIGFAVNPVSMMALRRQGIQGPMGSGGVVSVLAFAAASLITYWSGWPSVPYAVAILAVLSLGFGLFYRVRGGFTNALWYMVWILFITAMTYVGSEGAQNLIPFGWASLIVVVVSVGIFLPWGVASRLPEVARRPAAAELAS